MVSRRGAAALVLVLAIVALIAVAGWLLEDQNVMWGTAALFLIFLIMLVMYKIGGRVSNIEVLRALRERSGDTHEVANRIRGQGSRPVNFSDVDSTLRWLEKAGLVSSVQLPVPLIGHAAPPKYILTRRGIDYLKSESERDVPGHA